MNHQQPETKEKTMEDTNNAYAVSTDELRKYVEQYERLEAEKTDATEAMKEKLAEIKNRGDDTAVFRKVIALRKRKPDEIAEEEAIMEMYKTALGMV